MMKLGSDLQPVEVGHNDDQQVVTMVLMNPSMGESHSVRRLTAAFSAPLFFSNLPRSLFITTTAWSP